MKEAKTASWDLACKERYLVWKRKGSSQVENSDDCPVEYSAWMPFYLSDNLYYSLLFQKLLFVMNC
jgi:hypothetical protein